MPATLVESQVATLEPPTAALTIQATGAVEDVVSRIVAGLGLAAQSREP